MKHPQILTRAWHILWQYRALWVFGIILALTTVSAGGRSYYNLGQNDRQKPTPRQMNIDPNEPIWPQVRAEIKDQFDEAGKELDRILSAENQNQWERNLLTIVLWATGVLLVLYLVGRVFRYVSEASLIKMVDRYEESGEKLTARAGFRLGWSRQAWRLFLLDLVIELPLAVVFLLLFALVISPIFLWGAGAGSAALVGVVTSIGLLLLLILTWLVVRAILSLAKPLMRREIALNDLGVGAAIRQGLRTVRKYWKESGLMWLILTGIDLVWPLAMAPLALLAVGIGVLLGGGLTFLLGGRAIEARDPAMFWPILFGALVFLLVVAIPMAFLSGLRKTYQSSSWTLTFRELRVMAALQNGGDKEVAVIDAEPPVEA